MFLVGAFGLIFAIEKTKNSAAGVAMLLAFTFFMGLMLSRLLATVLGFSNGPALVMTAFGGTAVIFFAMATLSTRDQARPVGMGKFLFVGAIMLFVAVMANIFLQSSALMHDARWWCASACSRPSCCMTSSGSDGGETNYISATLAIYLNIYNVFQACWRSSASPAAANRRFGEHGASLNF